MKENNKKRLLRRLKILEGQIRGLQKMIQEDEYCIDVLQQSLAVQNALKQADSLILANHFHNCVTRAIKGDRKLKKEKVIKELLNIYKVSRR